MEYLKDKDGQIKVTDGKGNFKFLPPHIALNKRRQAALGFEPVEAPKKFDPIPSIEVDEIETVEQENENTDVAETAPAKRGRKPKQE